MQELMNKSKPRFQIGDVVRLKHAKHPGSFVISGITKGANGKYFYSHDDVDAGWMDEEHIEFYITEEQSVYVEEIERLLWKLEGVIADVLDQKFQLSHHGDIPRYLQEEMDRVARMLSRRTG